MSHLGVQKIISGGQSGVDQGALYAGEKLGIETGGWIPLRGMTVEGEKLKLLNSFGCKEISNRSDESLSKQYVRRSKLNVDSSDGCLAIRLKKSVGTDFTLGYCLTGRWQSYNSKKEVKNPYKPVLMVDDLNAVDKYRKEIHNFILDNKIMVLNVFGHRDSYLKTNTMEFLIKVLSE